MKPIKLKKILEAKHDFGRFIKTTPLELSKRFSEKYEANIYLKREDLQPVRSYKIRGAFHKINSLSKEEQKKGIVCASAGNHAQGVAITCKHLKIKGTIYMPVTTPEQKVYKTKQFGGKYVNVILVGDTFDESLKASQDLQKKTGASFVHPFDDPKTIEGQATIGLEIFDAMGDEKLDYIICPIGGGGVITGLINAARELSPHTKIIGAEPAGAQSMKKSLKIGENSTLDSIDIFVDGAAVGRVGENPFDVANEYGLHIVPCPENRVCSTILEYLKEDGYVVEPAGALATDALKDLKKKIKGKNVAVIISGGNFDFERLPEVKERSLKFEGKKKYYIVSFPQRPGALKEFLECLGPDDDIARFEYMKKSNKDKAPVLFGIESDSAESFDEFEECAKRKGYKLNDITNDEVYFDLLI